MLLLDIIGDFPRVHHVSTIGANDSRNGIIRWPFRIRRSTVPWSGKLLKILSAKGRHVQTDWFSKFGLISGYSTYIYAYMSEISTRLSLQDFTYPFRSKLKTLEVEKQPG